METQRGQEGDSHEELSQALREGLAAMVWLALRLQGSDGRTQLGSWAFWKHSQARGCLGHAGGLGRSV